MHVDVSAHALRYFVALAEEGHMGRAAERLHLTVPSLSEQTARLERQLQTALFTRGPRGVELTEAGEELLPMARAAAEAHDAVRLWAAQRSAEQVGAVRVGVFAAAGGPLRSAVQAAMAARHPQVEVATRRTGFDDAFPALRGGRLDAAYLPEPLPRELPGIRWATVTRQRRLLLVPSDHRLAGRDAVSIEETNGETFLTLAGAPPTAVDWWLVDPRADGSHPVRGPAAGDFEDLLDLCADGRGLGFASDFAVTNYLRPGVSFVRLTDVEDARTALCWRADERDPAVLAFVATARAVAGVRSS
ncbi:LysR substrate-binding domain-containing protein [Geodermatophilus aquaeductus]|uniref:DNA-binding transcriptional regulator, LysR family n=1 Tax=Geodermatophilus aquaeductus TaxID=1564161 RepID=A0A521FJ47_9ACTN|nr:DNA-binding transcriptional regulator, LysR family [Geodermatophilus aquaeductus]